MNALKQLAARGLVWTIAGYGGGQLLRFGGNLLVTRLLTPEYFGLMALVNIFLMGLNLFSDVGISISIVQSPRGDDRKFLNTAWTIQVMRGFGLWLVCCLIAYPLAQYYEDPQLRLLLPIVGLSTIIGGFESTSLQTLQRHLSVRQLTMMELTKTAVQIGVMVTWAWFSPTVWALVAGGLTSDVLKLIWSHFLLPERNRFTWDRSCVQELFSIGRWIFASTALTFLAEQADRLVLGKLFSLELLGVYGIALMLSDMPRQLAIAISQRVILPATSKMVDMPRSEYRSTILHHRRVLLWPMAVGMMLLIGFGDLMVRFLYDDRYLAASWMLPILAIGIWPRLLCCTIECSLFSLGKMQYTTIGNFFRLVSTVGGILLGYAWFGPVGAVVAIALNDLVYYTVVSVGLCREGIGCLRQDLRATLMLLGGVLLLGLGRMALSLNFAVASVG